VKYKDLFSKCKKICGAGKISFNRLISGLGKGIMIDVYKKETAVKNRLRESREKIKISAAPLFFYGQGLRITTLMPEKTGLSDR
jgi:hypothetical protein